MRNDKYANGFKTLSYFLPVYGFNGEFPPERMRLARAYSFTPVFRLRRGISVTFAVDPCIIAAAALSGSAAS